MTAACRNPHIVEYWGKVDRAVKKCVRDRVETRVGNIVFTYRSGMLFIKLPSGRSLAYVKPHIGVNRYGSEAVMYYGLDSNRHFTECESYGGKIVENLTQATSRDILVHVTGEEFVAVSRYVADEIGIDYFDECSYRPNQLMYWPKERCRYHDPRSKSGKGTLRSLSHLFFKEKYTGRTKCCS